jgi:hypothetical protein
METGEPGAGAGGSKLSKWWRYGLMTVAALAVAALVLERESISREAPTAMYHMQSSSSSGSDVDARLLNRMELLISKVCTLCQSYHDHFGHGSQGRRYNCSHICN